MLRELLADEAGSACACGHWQGMLVPAHGTQVCRSEDAGQDVRRSGDYMGQFICLLYNNGEMRY